MLRGMATVSYWADDLEAAKRWYADLLGIEPYFSVPGVGGKVGYYEFRVGDNQDELGLIDSRYRPETLSPGPGGTVMYWHVDDVHAAHERLVALGCTEIEPLKDRGEGFITTAFLDPFGNVLGVMYNPHFVEMNATDER
ncbi:VOC family protein [Spiractinospora alimapuensis]|uniref:VOC family protein n=1 Tax=Spiractinospora alimapuensis TaxID=2820884 RepID=UPI001F29AD0C|nr:VOC family protein [Spiractinospora alimapuensis]QVQ49986.1 VOC family protein [Spiractinospora alimapuensis]